MRQDPALSQRPRGVFPRRWRLTIALPVVVVVIVAALLVQYFRPIPAVAGTPTAGGEQRVAGDAPTMPWPEKGEAAVAVQGLGQLGSFGGESPLPIASITKVMTAYIVLQDHPLLPGDQGAPVTITDTDVTNFKQRQAAGESVVAVKAGDKWSLYQLLQGLLLPSGNNLADTLARFDADAVDAFVAKMNAAAAKLGLQHTKFADTNGASNQSTSTPGDLIKLESAALLEPAFAEIVKQPEATLPTAGRVFNVNAILGQEGIVGVKTGSLPDVAIANFAFAATAQVGGQTVTVLGVVLGQDSLAKAFDASKALIRTVRASIKLQRMVNAADQVGIYEAPWGAKTNVAAPKDVDMLTWPGLLVKTSVDLRAITTPAGGDAAAGTMTVTLGDQQVKLDLKTSAPLAAPGKRWRLTRTS